MKDHLLNKFSLNTGQLDDNHTIHLAVLNKHFTFLCDNKDVLREGDESDDHQKGRRTDDVVYADSRIDLSSLFHQPADSQPPP